MHVQKRRTMPIQTAPSRIGKHAIIITQSPPLLFSLTFPLRPSARLASKLCSASALLSRLPLECKRHPATHLQAHPSNSGRLPSPSPFTSTRALAHNSPRVNHSLPARPRVSPASTLTYDARQPLTPVSRLPDRNAVVSGGWSTIHYPILAPVPPAI